MALKMIVWSMPMKTKPYLDRALLSWYNNQKMPQKFSATKSFKWPVKKPIRNKNKHSDIFPMI